MLPYKRTTFEFTTESKDWINRFFGPIVDNFQRNATSLNALVKFTDEQYNELISSAAWSELLVFATSNNLKDPYPQAFIYKKLDKPKFIKRGNPHLDTYGPTGIDYTVPTRLNILLNGDEDTEMVWWDYNRSSEIVVNFALQRPDGSYAGRLQAKGNSIDEQWELLGEPKFRTNNLGFAALVRTDVLHALNWSGANPRLILSVRFSNEWATV